MENTRQLILSLNKSQIRNTRIFLSAFSSRKEVNSKFLEVFNLILQKPNINREEISLELYGSESKTNVRMLISRLHYKILDVLMLDINLEGSKNSSSENADLLKIKKRLAQFFYLYFTLGSMKVTQQLLSEIINMAKAYEDYNTLQIALGMRRSFASGRLIKIGEEDSEIEKANHCSSEIYKAGKIYNTMLRMQTTGKGRKAYLKYLDSSIKQLENSFETTHSKLILFYLTYFRFRYFISKDNYVDALYSAEMRLALLKKEKAIRRDVRIAAAYGDIAQTGLFINKEKQSIVALQTGYPFLPYGSPNYNGFKEIEFLAHLGLRDYGKSYEVLLYLQSTSQAETGSFVHAKYNYFNAVILFLKGNYKESLRAAQQKFEISKDKVGWELGIRILIILNLIELSRLDEATKLVSNLERHLNRWKEDSEVFLRFQVIQKCLMEMMRKGFDRLQPGKRLPLLIQNLEVQPKLKWQPFTPEIIPFHKWAAKRYKISLS